MEKEKAIVLDETDAATLYAAICSFTANRKWDLSNDAEWFQLVHAKGLEEKLRKYLNKGTGEVVIER